MNNLQPFSVFDVREPIFSAIVLVWIKSKLFNDDFYDWTSLTMTIPCAFHILDEVFPHSQMK